MTRTKQILRQAVAESGPGALLKRIEAIRASSRVRTERSAGRCQARHPKGSLIRVMWRRQTDDDTQIGIRRRGGRTCIAGSDVMGQRGRWRSDVVREMRGRWLASRQRVSAGHPVRAWRAGDPALAKPGPSSSCFRPLGPRFSPVKSLSVAAPRHASVLACRYRSHRGAMRIGITGTLQLVLLHARRDRDACCASCRRGVLSRLFYSASPPASSSGSFPARPSAAAIAASVSLRGKRLSPPQPYSQLTSNPCDCPQSQFPRSVRSLYTRVHKRPPGIVEDLRTSRSAGTAPVLSPRRAPRLAVQRLT